MCIILTKPKGIAAPNWDSVVTSCNNNPDGFAVVWHRAGMAEPEIKRTLNKNEFLEYFKPICSDTSASWVLHARIKSAGSIKLENCHCWKDSNTGLVFCHNGTLSLKAHADMTDSETFFRHLYIPAILGGGDANAVVEAVIGASKFAFMTKDGDIVTHGKYVTDAAYPGVQFSNSSYKPYVPTSTKWGNYKNYGGYAYADDYSWEDYDYLYPSHSYNEKKVTRKDVSKLLLANHSWHFYRPNSVSAGKNSK